jgi:hypothetical protein
VWAAIGHSHCLFSCCNTMHMHNTLRNYDELSTPLICAGRLALGTTGSASKVAPRKSSSSNRLASVPATQLAQTVSPAVLPPPGPG